MSGGFRLLLRQRLKKFFGQAKYSSLEASSHQRLNETSLSRAATRASRILGKQGCKCQANRPPSKNKQRQEQHSGFRSPRLASFLTHPAKPLSALRDAQRYLSAKPKDQHAVLPSDTSPSPAALPRGGTRGGQSEPGVRTTRRSSEAGSGTAQARPMALPPKFTTVTAHEPEKP